MAEILTPERVMAAYGAMSNPDRDSWAEYWAEDMVWLVPGHNQLSGWK